MTAARTGKAEVRRPWRRRKGVHTASRRDVQHGKGIPIGAREGIPAAAKKGTYRAQRGYLVHQERRYLPKQQGNTCPSE
eukprot:6213513-Pleurochrysis_carterae.AAC.4